MTVIKNVLRAVSVTGLLLVTPAEAQNYMPRAGGTATFLSIGAGNWTLGNQTAVAGGNMQVDNRLEVNTDPVAGRGALWSGKTYAFSAWSKEFTSTSPFAFTGTASPQFVGLFNATNTSSGYDVVALGALATAKASNGRVEAGNFVCLSGGGSLTGVDINCLEVDFEPAAGDTTSGGGAVSAVVYSGHHGAPGFYTAAGTGGDAFQYDFMAATAYEAGFETQNAQVIGYKASDATYTNAAFLLGVDTPSTNQQRVRWGWGGTNIFDAYNDGTNMHFDIGGTGFAKFGVPNGAIFRPTTDQNMYLRGKQALSTGVTISSLNDANNAFEGLELQATAVRVSVGTLQATFPTSCSGLPTGTLWNNAGTAAFCP